MPSLTRYKDFRNLPIKRKKSANFSCFYVKLERKERLQKAEMIGLKVKEVCPAVKKEKFRKIRN